MSRTRSNTSTFHARRSNLAPTLPQSMTSQAASSAAGRGCRSSRQRSTTSRMCTTGYSFGGHPGGLVNFLGDDWSGNSVYIDENDRSGESWFEPPTPVDSKPKPDDDKDKGKDSDPAPTS